MKNFIDKLIGRLENKENLAILNAPNTTDIQNVNYQKWMMKSYGFKEAIEIVNQLAEEYKSRVMINDEYCWQKCSAIEHCKECNRLGNGTIDYFENYDSLTEEHKEKDCFNCSRRTWYQKGYADAMEHINTSTDSAEWKQHLLNRFEGGDSR